MLLIPSQIQGSFYFTMLSFLLTVDTQQIIVKLKQKISMPEGVRTKIHIPGLFHGLETSGFSTPNPKKVLISLLVKATLATGINKSKMLVT